MRRLAQVILGSLTLALMVVAQPWGLEDCPPTSCSSSTDASLPWTILGTLLEVTIPGVILLVVLVGVLGIRDSGRASDAAVYAALGQTQGTAARTAARRGLVDGFLVTGVAYVAAGALNVFLVLRSGYGLLDSGASPQLWIVRAVMALAFTAILVLAHVIDSVRPRRTPVERLYEEAAIERPRRISLALRAVVLGTIGAAAAGVLVGTAAAHDIANGDAGTIATLAAEAAVWVIGLAALGLFFTVGVPLLRKAMTPVLTGTARLAGASRASHAAAVLHTRATTASGTSARTVLAIAGLALLAGSLAYVDPAPSFAPSYVGTITASPAGIGDELATQIAALPGVGAVVVGRSTSTASDTDIYAVGIDPADLVGVDDQLAGMLSAHPGALVSSSFWSDMSVDRYTMDGIAITGILRTSTCCVAVVDRTTVAVPDAGSSVLIWAKPGADPVAVGKTVDNYSDLDVPTLESYGSSMVQSNSTTDLGGAIFIAVLLVLVCGGPVVALAYGVVRRRGREDATLAALGASRRSLTGAAVVETTVIAAIAVAGGLLAGAAVQMIITGASAARDSLHGLITDSYVQTMWGSVAWNTIAWMFLIAVASFALVAVAVKLLARGALPAEQLRAAEEGVLS